MKGNWNIKKFLALFMAVAMVMVSGVFVTTQSFKATDDEGYVADEAEDITEVSEDYEEDAGEVEEETTEIDAEEDYAEEDYAEEDYSEEETAEETVEEETYDEASEADVASSVTVSFDVNGGEGSEPGAYAADVVEDGGVVVGELPRLEDFTDGDGANHIFAGWSTDENASEPDTSFYYQDSDELRLYAVWNVEEPAAEEQEEAEEEVVEEAAEEEASEDIEEVSEEEASEDIGEASEEEASEEAVEEASEPGETADENREDADKETADESREDADKETADESREDADKETADENREDADKETADESREDADKESAEESKGDEESADKSKEDADKESADENKEDEDKESSDENKEDEESADENREDSAEGNAEETAAEVADAGAQADVAEAAPAEPVSATTSSGLEVIANYSEGVLPAGTTMKVEDVSDEEALAAVGDAVEGATEARAVNITFYDAEGNEIQPNGEVAISMSVNSPLMGDRQTLVHVDDSGNASVVSGANTTETGASFQASSFSIYVLVGNGQESVDDYENRTFDYSIEAYQELTLAENVARTEGDKSVFLGGTWAIASGEDIISFPEGATLNPSDSEEAPAIEITTSGKGGDATVTYTYKAKDKDEQAEQEYVDTYTIHVKGYMIHFDLNGGSGQIEDQSMGMSQGGSALVQLPSGEGLSRPGYNFKGWATRSDAISASTDYGWAIPIYGGDDGNAATLSDMFQIRSGDAESYTLYAAWAPNSGVGGNIGFYIRKDGTIQTEPGRYGSAQYTTVTPGKVGSKNQPYSIYVSNLSDYITEVYTETNVENSDRKITAKAWSELNAWNEYVHNTTGQWYWNPDSQYITWYVIKDQGGEWHVDGVLRGSDEGDQGQVNLDYLPNCSNYSGQCPVGRQYTKGSEVTIEGQATIRNPGYNFGGWNTAKDGSGFGYQEGDKITLNENTTLYAQWLPGSETEYRLLCYNTETDQEISDTMKVRYGVTGNTVEANDDDKRLPGYSFDEGNEKNKLSAQIKADGTTTLKLWFNPGHHVTVEAVNISRIYDGTEVTEPIAVIKVDGEEVSYTQNDSGITFTYNGKEYTIPGVTASIRKGSETVPAAKDAGSYEVVFSGSDAKVQKNGKDTAFTLELKDGYINISKRTVNITSKSGEWEYDGKVHKLEEVEVTGDGWADGDGLPTLRYTGQQKAPGESDNSFEKLTNKSWEEEFPNYDISITFGKLKVNGRDTKFELNITADSGETAYNGSRQTVDPDAFSVEGAVETASERNFFQRITDAVSGSQPKSFVLGGDTYTLSGLSVTGEGENAGEYPVTFTGKETIKDSDGTDVTEQFLIKKTEGKLTINKVDVTLKSKDLTKQYDGDELVNGDNPLEIEAGWIEGQGAEYSFSGSQTNPGSSPNAFGYTAREGTDLNNYNITKTEGNLTVTSSNAAFEVTVTPNSGEFKYDGTEHSVSGFVGQREDGSIPVTAGGREYYVSGLTAGKAATYAGKQNVDVSGTAVVRNKKGDDLTGEFTVKIGTGILEITRRSITITSASLEKPYDGSALTNPEGTLEVTEAPEGAEVTGQGSVSGDGLVESDVITYEFSGSQTLVGSANNTFTYSLSNADNYNVSVAYGTLTIRNRDARFDVTVVGNTSTTPVYDGTEKTASGFVGQTEDGRIPVQVGNDTYYVEGITTEAKGTDAGEYTGTINGTPKVTDKDGNDVTEQFNVTTQPGKLVINKASVTLKSADLNKPYDGTALTNGTTAMETESGWAPGEGATYTFTGSQTLLGSSANAYTYSLLDNTKADNYNITKSEGTLTITNRGSEDLLQVQITAQSGEFEYDGKDHSVSGFINETDKGVEVNAGGQNYYVTGYESSATAKNATSDEGIATSISGTPTVKDASGNDVSAQFSVTPVPGKLVIKKRDLVLASADITRPYNGTPLTNQDEPLAKEKGWADGEGATYTFTGTRTKVGTTPNSFTINVNEGTSLDNYNLKQTEGSLTVTSRDAKYEVTIQGKSEEFTYDGATHTVSGFENEDDQGRVAVEADGNTYYVTGMTSTASAKNVRDSGKTTVSGTPVVTDASGEDVSDQFAVTALSGKLTIGKRKITLTSESKDKVYDGYPLTGEGGKITVGGEGLAAGETLDVTFTGSITNVGSVDNTFTYRIGKVGGQIAAEEGSDETGFFGFGFVVHAAELEDGTIEDGDISNYEIEVVYGKLKVTASGQGEDGQGIDPSRVVTKTHEDGIYAIGQEIEFRVSATNIYNDTRAITFIEQENVTLDQEVFDNVAPGETVSTIARHTVTEEDAVKGSYSNVVRASFSDAESGTEGSEGGEGFDSTPDEVTIEALEPSLSVTKKSDQSQAVRVGSTINYSILVVNNGNSTVKGINVVDELTGDSWTIDSLTTGGSKEFETSYTVTEADVASGRVTNVAKASGQDPSGNDIEGSAETGNDVNRTFNLTIHYVDEEGNTVAADYRNSYQYRESFYVQSPEVSGYTPTYTYVGSDENGMPSRDVDVNVTYVKNEQVVPETPSPQGGSSGNDSSDTTTNVTNTSNNITNNITDNSGSGDSDNDDDDYDDDNDNDRSGSGSGSGSKASSSSSRRKASRDRDNVNTTQANNSRAGINPDGSTTSVATATPAVNNTEVRRSSSAGRRTGSDGGAVISVGEDGTPKLVAASDTETPLMNLGLEEHACNVLRLLILLIAMGIAIAHTKKMKQHQRRIFELREKLMDEQKRR